MTNDKFAHLRDIFPRVPEQWSVSDIGNWLDYLHMTRYKDIFKEMAIDGMLIFDLTDDDLKKEMSIDLSLHRKKILKAKDLLDEFRDLQKSQANDPRGKHTPQVHPMKPKNQSSESTNSNSKNSNKNKESNSNFAKKNNNANSKSQDSIDVADAKRNEDTLYYLVERGPENPFLSNMLNGSLDLNLELSKEEIDLQVVNKIRDLTDQLQQENKSDVLWAGGKDRNEVISGQAQNYKDSRDADWVAADKKANNDLMMGKDLETNFHSEDDDSLDLKFYRRSSDKENNGAGNLNSDDGYYAPGLGSKGYKLASDLKNMDIQKPPAEQKKNRPPYNPHNAGSTELILIKKDTEPMDTKHTIKEAGIQLGRNSANGIVVMDETVSRFHSKIEFSNSDGNYYLRDIGSTAGTYIVLDEPRELKPDMIFEVGSYELKIRRINIKTSNYGGDGHMHYNSANFLEISIEEGPDKEETRHIISEEGVVGRANGNSLTFPDDQHMSFRHCKLYFENNKYWMCDLNSTNGTLLRLSAEGSPSEGHQIKEGNKLRVGITQYFEVERIARYD